MEGAKDRKTFRHGRRIHWAGSWLLLCLAAEIWSCGPFLSKESLQRVSWDLTSSEVIDDPDSYTGDTVLWGGVIRENIRGDAGTTVVIDQAPLDRRGYPQIETTLGEFIARTPLVLDPQRYRAGRKITVAGRVDGVEEAQLGATQYPRPVLQALDMYLWDEKLWGVFPISRGWKVDQSGPVPSPFEAPYEEGAPNRRSFP